MEFDTFSNHSPHSIDSGILNELQNGQETKSDDDVITLNGALFDTSSFLADGLLREVTDDAVKRDG
jgi:hypothetical protein